MRTLRPARNTPSRRVLLASAAVGLLFLSACGGSDADDTSVPVAATTGTGGTDGGQAPAGAAALTVADPWVKTAKAGMTAAFGSFENTGTVPLTILSAKTSASDRTELHEVVGDAGSMTMRPKTGGFTIPAGQKLELEPGGLHIMIMDMKKPVAAGDEVTLRLTLGDGTTKDFTALAKETTAGEEKYESEGMDMNSDMNSDMNTDMSEGTPSASATTTP